MTRATFSRIGYTIWSGDSRILLTVLLCAALIERRFCILLLAFVAAVRLMQRPQPAEAVIQPYVKEEEPPLRVALAPADPDAPFRPEGRSGVSHCPEVLMLRQTVAQALVGQTETIDGLLIGLLAGGHIVLEGAPGLAKTFACRTLARSMNASFKRVQCTADLLPADLTGCEIYDVHDGCFRTRPGPIFANVVLIDEINRAAPGAQAGLLEAMSEGHVTIAEESHVLPEVFMVLATMNDADRDGTFPLPQAQLDRFLFKIVLDFPSRADERAILERHLPSPEYASAVVDTRQVLAWRELVGKVYCSPSVLDYIIDVVRAARAMDDAQRGPGPRASLGLLCAARAKAFLEQRSYVRPADVRDLACAVLRHRMPLDYHDGNRRDVEARLRALLEVTPAR